MKFLVSQLATMLKQPIVRANFSQLTKLVVMLLVLIGAYSVVFHVLMVYEGRSYSWLTGVYWTLTVMSTLGFGDITFHSDLGLLFTIIVLVSGIILLLIMLPSAFVRFYGPWLEARLKLRTPRTVPTGTKGHVLICIDDPIAAELRKRLTLLGVPHYTLVEDLGMAAELYDTGVPVIVGDPQEGATWSATAVQDARCVFANVQDAENTNIVLTVRQLDTKVPILATADLDDSIDLLELSGATQVLPIRRQLGEQLANRVNAGHAEVRPLGTYRGLELGEFPVHNTPLAGRTLRELELHRRFGVTVVGVWTRGGFATPNPDHPLVNTCVVVVIGTAAQLLDLNTLLVIYDTNYAPTLVIGGGRVGRAAAMALRARDVAVHVIELNESVAAKLGDATDKVFVGNAADRELLRTAGLDVAPAVILTTNNDSTNIYLTVYFRKLNPGLRIISRITNESNLEAVHRAGADFVLSYASLGAESVVAALKGRDVMLLGTGVELFDVRVPRSVVGKTLAQSEIRSRTGVSVIAIQRAGTIDTGVTATTLLPDDGELLLVGTHEQRVRFVEMFS